MECTYIKFICKRHQVITSVEPAVAVEPSERVQTVAIRDKADSGARADHGPDETPLLSVRVEYLRRTKHLLTVETADYVYLC